MDPGGIVRGAPVVLVGGVGQRASAWAKWTAALDEAGRAWAIADVPRAGFTTAAGYDDAIIAARSALLARPGVDASRGVALIGHSAGGAASVRYLGAHPDQVETVVAITSPLAGNGVARAGEALLGPFAPRWVRDLSSSNAVRDALDPALAGRVTTISGAAWDGIVTARSTRLEGAHEVRVGISKAAPFAHRHDLMLSSHPDVRAAGLAAIGIRQP
jgi:pimeloyl-ACP methyl ester carboxylesterase